VGNVTNRTVTGLMPGTAYYYRVRAYNGNGASGNSMAIPLMTLASIGTTSIRLGDHCLQAANGQFSFDITGPADTAVAIELSTNLMSTWQAIETNELTTGIAWLTNAVTAESQFYRARIVSP
jgi:hypothetical protein